MAKERIPEVITPGNVVESADTGAAATGGVVRETATRETPEEDQDLINPLGEEMIDVKAKPGAEFFHQTYLRKPGDTFKMTRTQAIAAAHLVDEVTPNGVRAVSNAQQQVTAVTPGHVLAGMARHERIGALQTELQQIDSRKAEVERQLQTEQAAMDRELEARKRENDQRAAAVNTPPQTGDSQAYAPGTSGAPGNTAVPPRPGEPGNTKR